VVSARQAVTPGRRGTAQSPGPSILFEKPTVTGGSIGWSSRSLAARYQLNTHILFNCLGGCLIPNLKRGSFAVLLVPFAAAHSQQPAADSVDRFVTSEMKREQVPGLSLAVIRDGRVLLRRGYGYANLELRVPASDSTIYQSGSLGKQFTAAAVATLAEQGRLRLDDLIVKWLPEGKKAWSRVTVRHLLTHTSGVAEYTDSTFDYRKDYTEDQLVNFAASRPLDFAPGERWSYSNTGYLLLGVLIHRLTGRFYGEVLHDLIFAPVGMKTTRIISEADLVPNRADGYQLAKDGIRNQDWVAPSLNTTADGSLYFSLDDLIAWSRSLDAGLIPDSTVLRQAWTPVKLNDGGLYPYGFGWDLTPQRDHVRIGHTGSWQGFKTALYRYPEFKLTVIALANLAEAEPGLIAEAVAGIVEPALTPAHQLQSGLPGPQPARSAEQVLRAAAQDNDQSVLTPGLRRFLSPGSKRELKRTLAPVRTWTALGCDDLSGLRLAWLGSPIARACYARGSRQKDRVLATVYFTPDWMLASFDVSPY
jgi:CubicO group peptidase (beta-lactamase class C family)